MLGFDAHVHEIGSNVSAEDLQRIGNLGQVPGSGVAVGPSM